MARTASPVVNTIDIIGLRCIVDAVGHLKALKLLRRLTSSDGTSEIPCLTTPPAWHRKPTLQVHGNHATIYNMLDETLTCWVEGSKMTIRGGILHLPETLMTALPGRPASTLLDHPAFDPSITILEIDGKGAASSAKTVSLSHTRRSYEDAVQSLIRLERP